MLGMTRRNFMLLLANAIDHFQITPECFTTECSGDRSTRSRLGYCFPKYSQSSFRRMLLREIIIYYPPSVPAYLFAKTLIFQQQGKRLVSALHIFWRNEQSSLAMIDDFRDALPLNCNHRFSVYHRL